MVTNMNFYSSIKNTFYENLWEDTTSATLGTERVKRPGADVSAQGDISGLKVVFSSERDGKCIYRYKKGRIVS